MAYLSTYLLPKKAQDVEIAEVGIGTFPIADHYQHHSPPIRPLSDSIIIQ